MVQELKIEVKHKIKFLTIVAIVTDREPTKSIKKLTFDNTKPQKTNVTQREPIKSIKKSNLTTPTSKGKMG